MDPYDISKELNQHFNQLIFGNRRQENCPLKHLKTDHPNDQIHILTGECEWSLEPSFYSLAIEEGHNLVPDKKIILLVKTIRDRYFKVGDFMLDGSLEQQHFMLHGFFPGEHIDIILFQAQDEPVCYTTSICCDVQEITKRSTVDDATLNLEMTMPLGLSYACYGYDFTPGEEVKVISRSGTQNIELDKVANEEGQFCFVIWPQAEDCQGDMANIVLQRANEEINMSVRWGHLNETA